MSVMTTQYSAAQQPLASPTFRQYYNGGVQYNPAPNPNPNTNLPQTTTSNNTSPSSSASPPSPHTTFIQPALATQIQSRQPKKALYVPAVLRPTDKPLRNSPPKDGARGSFDNPESGPATPVQRLGTAGSYESGINRVITEDWSDDALCKVTGPPTRDHWKPDPSSPKCTSPSCTTAFSLVTRRHHCRRCGNLFCHSHSSGVVPLDQHARFHPDGTVQRACDACYADYEQWTLMRSSRSRSVGSQGTEGDDPSRAMGVPVGHRRGQQGAWGKTVGSLAQSVPRDWSWSTF